jgi:hypothetical protein
MRRLPLLLIVLLSAAALPAAAARVLDSTSVPASPAPATAVSDTMSGAVAGVLVAALTEQFDGRSVSIMLDQVSAEPASIRDSTVIGQGRARIGGDEEWIGFRFSTLYDTAFNSAAWPEITLGGVTSEERDMPNDPMLVRQLDERVVERLGQEFAEQTVRLQLDRISTVEAGSHYLRIDASGIADFGPEGTSSARIEALYDLRDRAWLRVDYELGPGAGLGKERDALPWPLDTPADLVLAGAASAASSP